MAGREETRGVLEALKADRATARERQSAMERQIREEARRLQSTNGTGAFHFYFCCNDCRFILARVCQSRVE